MGKCFDGDTKVAPTPTLQTSSLLSGATILPLCALCIFRIRLGTARVINGKKLIFDGGSGSFF